MFSTYDLKAFSKRLKEIRKSLKFTQENVVAGTGLSAETLRKLENGLVIPRYDTIEILSLFYKTDLQSVLNNYKSSKELIKFYDMVDYLVTHSNFESLLDTIQSFEIFSKNFDSNLIEKKELEQLGLFFKGLHLSITKQNNQEMQQNAIDIYIDSLKATNPKYNFDKWQEFKYSHVELRILFAIASLYGYLRSCELSNEILNFVLESLDYTSYSKHYDKLLITKVLSTISYNYHRIDRFEESLAFAQKGIDYCNEHSIMSYLPLFLFRKGVSEYYLKIDGYETNLDYAITLLKIQNQQDEANHYQLLSTKYR